MADGSAAMRILRRLPAIAAGPADAHSLDRGSAADAQDGAPGPAETAGPSGRTDAAPGPPPRRRRRGTRRAGAAARDPGAPLRAARSSRRETPRNANDADPSAPSVAATAPPDWADERERLLEMLAQQQRVAQAGLVTAGMAHDVHNHLQVLTGSACLALMSDRPEDWRDALRDVQEQCREIAETTRAFLSFVRRRDAVGETSFVASDAVEQARRLASPLAKKHGVRLEPAVRGDAVVAGESRLLVQALVNLISNAVRACAGNRGRITVEAWCPAPGTCRFEVTDDGPGIPESVRGRLFRPFATGHAESGGNGLGLFIVRQTVRRLGGTIRVRTSPSGTTFVVDVPAAR